MKAVYSEVPQTVERTRLVISISGKTAQQMAEEYGFDEKQLGYVTELLSDEYSDLWASLSVPGWGLWNPAMAALCTPSREMPIMPASSLAIPWEIGGYWGMGH